MFKFLALSFCSPGETLQDERTNGGAIVNTDGMQLPYKLIPVRFTIFFPVCFFCTSVMLNFSNGGDGRPPAHCQESIILKACVVKRKPWLVL